MNNTHWLKHDCNAQHDPKIIDLLIKHKWEGYGLFWALVERLSLESNYKLKRKYDRIAFALRADKERIKSLVEDFELFILEDDYFYSESLMKRMEKLDLIKQKRAIAGAKGGKSKASAKQLLSKPVANSSRLDKIREDKSRVDKSREEIVENDDVLDAFKIYNDFAKKHDLACAKKLTGTRRQKLKQRLNDCGGVEEFKNILLSACGSDFLMGKNDRRWKMDFDFVLFHFE